jgi:hypothetical protein
VNHTTGNWTSEGQPPLAESGGDYSLLTPLLNAVKNNKNEHVTSSSVDVLHHRQSDEDTGAMRYADAVMASMLCLGSAIAVTSLTALVAIAIRKRVLRQRRNRRIDSSSAVANRLLFGKCDGIVTSSTFGRVKLTDRKYFYHPCVRSTVTLPLTRPTTFCHQSASCVDPYVGRVAMPTARPDGRRTYVSTPLDAGITGATTSVMAWPQRQRYNKRYCDQCDCCDQSFYSMCSSSTDSCVTV